MWKDVNEVTAIQTDRVETDIQSLIQKVAKGKIIFTSFPVSSQKPGVTTGWAVPHAQSREAPSLVSGIHVTHVRSGAWVCSAV